MKKFKKWLKRLSLSQQLFTLIFSFIAFFTFFFFIYISNNVEKYTNNQMFSLLQIHQHNLSSFYHGKDDIDADYVLTDKDSDILSFYFEIQNEKVKKVIYPKHVEMTNSLKKELSDLVVYYLNSHKNEMNYISKEGDMPAYFTVSRLDDDLIMVSMLNNQYALDFKNDLISSVIDITVFVVGIFFIILMLWVTYIIHPLNQIRTYIEKIKMGKDAVLKVNREDEIGELATALVNMREELKHQEKTKEEMIHNISHDLKTPIATIKSYGESIKDGIYPYDTLEKSVDVIIENAERLEKKVHSLLFLNRVEYLASQEQDEVMCDMKDVVETVVLNTKVIRPEIEVEKNLRSSYFRGGEESWRGAVENILENALRYAETQIVITLDEKQLCIYNDGPPFKEEQIPTLFNAFEKGQGGQFGLGLSIVKKVVTANKYKVVAENVETGGVIFKIMK